MARERPLAATAPADSVDTKHMEAPAACLLIPREPAAARPVSSAEHGGPLTEAHFSLLRRAQVTREPIRKAARTARFSALTTLAISLAGVPVALFSPSWLSTAAIMAIGAIGVVEYVGARRMRRGELSAASLLGTNQLVFMGLIVAYCVTQMLTFSTPAGQSTLLPADLRAQLAQLEGVEGVGLELGRQLDFWAPLAAYGFYSLVILLTVCFQGGLAVYYFTRRQHLREFRAATPGWVQRVFGVLGI